MITLLSPPTGQSDWCLSWDFVQNQFSKFFGCDCACSVIARQYLYLARKTRLRVNFHFTFLLLQSRGSSLWLLGHSNLYELSSICSVKFDVQARLLPHCLCMFHSADPLPFSPSDSLTDSKSTYRSQAIRIPDFSVWQGSHPLFIKVSDIVQPILQKITDFFLCMMFLSSLDPTSSYFTQLAISKRVFPYQSGPAQGFFPLKGCFWNCLSTDTFDCNRCFMNIDGKKI